MIKVIYCDELKADYQNLFDHAKINLGQIPAVDRVVNQIVTNRPRYEAVAKVIGLPWYLVGLIHNLECGLSFAKHLHNGDPIDKPTTHVPAGRPHTAKPWDWTWETSAEDALRMLHMDVWHDWSIPGILYKLEGYNGYGYRQYHPTVKSPYLWAGTNQYIKGKYIADGHFDANAVSKQLGIAAVLKRMYALGLVDGQSKPALSS